MEIEKKIIVVGQKPSIEQWLWVIELLKLLITAGGPK